MLTVPIKFGTDGWRGRVADDFTIPNVRAVAQSIADYLKKHPVRGRKNAVAIGYDTRFLGERFAIVAAEVLAGSGFQVLLTSAPTPTPVLSLTIRLRRLLGAIVITASHNPAEYNGIKFKPYYAGPADPEMTRAFEQRLWKTSVRSMSLSEGLACGKIQRVDLMPAYIAFVRKFLDWRTLRRARLKIIIDAMHGAGDHTLAQILKGTGCRVTTLRGEPEPTFGGDHPEPIASHLSMLSSTMKKGRYDLGLATDGDADRVGVMNADGQFVTSQETMALLCLHLLEDLKWRGGLAKTVAGTNLMSRIAQTFGVPIYETPVGFKHIATLMRTGKALFGGEESGGFGISKVVPERDGALMGLLLAQMMVQRKKSLSQLLEQLRSRFGRWTYQRVDLKLEKTLPSTFSAALARRIPKSIAGKKVQTVLTTDGVKVRFSDDAWLLWRASGTEPLLRIYAEAQTLPQVKALLAAGKQLAGAKSQ